MVAGQVFGVKAKVRSVMQGILNLADRDTSGHRCQMDDIIDVFQTLLICFPITLRLRPGIRLE